MRAMLAGVCALLVLTGCGGADAEPAAAPPGASGTATPEPATVDGTSDCTHPAGFRVSHPADWQVNPGRVLPVCSWFAEETFTVPEASGIRTADITFSVRPVAELPVRWPDETARSRVEVDGRAALRVEQVATLGFYPAGTPITAYVLDLETDGTALVASTVGLPGTDYDRNVAVLDAMMASLVLDPASDV
ncbi:hypothetical protein [Blastococcus sp. SYSU DS0617]